MLQKVDGTKRQIQFTENRVEKWTTENRDPNPIHTDVEVASESTFGQRVVPGMMLMDQLSGMLTALGEEDEEVILSGITAARFRDPVFIGEHVTFTFEDIDMGETFTTVEYEARVEDRDSLVSSGVLSIVVKEM